MKTTSPRRLFALVPLALALGMSGVASAQIISDSFTRSGSLAGSTPDTSPGGESWSVYLSNGSGSATTNGSALNLTSASTTGTADEVASLGFTPAANTIYTLSATVTATSSTSGGYIALGFAGNTMGALGGQGYDWQFINNSNSIATFLGAGATNAEVGAAPGSTTAVLETVLNTANNTVTFYEGSSLGSLTLEGSSAYSVSGQTITDIFIDDHNGYNSGAGGNQLGSVDNLLLTATAAPEPSTWMLLAFGAGLIAVRSLRRARDSRFGR